MDKIKLVEDERKLLDWLQGKIPNTPDPGDGHGIMAAEAWKNCGLSDAWLKKLTQTFRSDGTLKGSISTAAGPVDKLEGVYTLHVIEGLAGIYGVGSAAMGRGFRARQLVRGVLKKLDAKLEGENAASA